MDHVDWKASGMKKEEVKNMFTLLYGNSLWYINIMLRKIIS